jgi:osomolarity two-component system response regulator SKN7
MGGDADKVMLARQQDGILLRIDELQQSRPPSAQDGRFGGVVSVNGNAAFVLPEDGDGRVEVSGEGQMPWGSGEGNGSAGSHDGANTPHQGLQVYTLGHLMPKSVGGGGDEEGTGNWPFDGAMFPESGLLGNERDQGQAQGTGYSVPDPSPNAGATAGANTSFGDSSAGAGPPAGGSSSSEDGQQSSARSRGSQQQQQQQKLRVRRSTFVPGWAVPPRVLLVDDDAVSRKLSSKFLQVFGCTIDVAVDGVGAVNKMNLEKYDLVLMVRLSLECACVC